MELSEKSRSNENLRDQLRTYRIVLDILNEDGSSREQREVALFENYQLEGEMNITKEAALQRLLNSGYTDQEAPQYLESLPVKVLEEVVYADAGRIKEPAYQIHIKQKIDDLLRMRSLGQNISFNF